MSTSTTPLQGSEWLNLLDMLEGPMAFYSLCFLTYRLEPTRRFTLEQWKYMLAKTHPSYALALVDVLVLRLQAGQIIEKADKTHPVTRLRLFTVLL